jgi:hypothetical protein
MPALINHRKSLIAISILYMTTLTIAGIHLAVSVSWSEHENRLTTYIDFDGLPAIIQTSDQKIWVVWQRSVIGQHLLFYVTSTDYGSTWSDQMNLTKYNSQSHDTHPSMIQLSNGTLFLVWASNRGDNYDIYYKTSSDLGASWSNAAQLTTDASQDKTPSVKQTKDGKICLAWCSVRTENFEIFYKNYNGTSWTNATQLTSSTKIDVSPTILETIDEKIYIFWSSTPPPPNEQKTGDIHYKYTSNSGSTWSSSIQFTTDKEEDTWPAAMQTSDTRIWVVWTSDRADQPDGNNDIWYRTSLVGDVNEDGIVGIVDLATVARAFGTKPGDTYWDPDADINKDSLVDIDDLILVSTNYGAT